MLDFMNFDFIITKITLVGSVPRGAGTPVHKDRYCHGLVFQTSGIANYTFDNGTVFDVTPDSIFYLPKHANYSIKGIPESSCRVINFDYDGEVFSPFVLKLKNPTNISGYFMRAENIWKLKSPGYLMKCKSELYGLLYELQKEFGAKYISGKKAEILRPAIEKIHNEYTSENISISSLADLCGISETYFRRIFVEKYGISPIKYINNLRLTRARELLAANLHTASAVSQMSGYKNECYFCREFKKATGVTPLEYSKNAQQ